MVCWIGRAVRGRVPFHLPTEQRQKRWYVGPKWRTERPRKTKIGTEVAHITRDSDTTFKVKGQRSTCRGRGHIVAASRTACYSEIQLKRTAMLYFTGQITVEIRVSSVKLKCGGLCGSEWINLSDIESHIDLLQQSAAAAAAQMRQRAARPANRKFKSPPTPVALSSRHRYRLQQVPAQY